ncbi:hypothetical protein L211DRAFT_787121 [Terfezia boudieri ATCC MYA-4762]|uniref:NADH dehydrogenase [ubiquinone] 1 alpha subcomplex subunit 1 n=1 Tax=Terfezia boudieri ATCC MYA-4762 TaxID=1051890 RepID=A0A3N4LP25_9PEZI|nr:hypothetical protein L211DRAFT_787121 [Terfezia boudieri ATCC MYA-4762]
MPVPFEALIPYGIMLVMFGATGAGMSAFRNYNNEGKRARRSLDTWDRVLMERDARLTGSLRGQRDDPKAPPGFETNSIWKVRSTCPILHGSPIYTG